MQRRSLMFKVFFLATITGCGSQPTAPNSSISSDQQVKPLERNQVVRTPYNLKVFKTLGQRAESCWLWTGTKLVVDQVNAYEVAVDDDQIRYHKLRILEIPKKPVGEGDNQPCEKDDLVLVKVNAYKPAEWEASYRKLKNESNEV